MCYSGAATVCSHHGVHFGINWTTDKDAIMSLEGWRLSHAEKLPSGHRAVWVGPLKGFKQPALNALGYAEEAPAGFKTQVVCKATPTQGEISLPVTTCACKGTGALCEKGDVSPMY